MIDVNTALILMLVGIVCAIAYTFLKEKHARKFDIDYVCGFVGKQNTPEERKRVREEARRHMEKKGFHFDYTEANQIEEARRLQEEEEREALRDYFRLEYERQREARKNPPAEVIPIADLFERREIQIRMVEEESEQRGVAVLYPKNHRKYVPPTPPKHRRRVKKRDGSSTYQLGLDISPVYGVKEQQASDKTFQNQHVAVEDDYPPNPEEAYWKHLEHAQEGRRRQEIKDIETRPYTIEEYRANLKAYDELRSKLQNLAV